MVPDRRDVPGHSSLPALLTCNARVTTFAPSRCKNFASRADRTEEEHMVLDHRISRRQLLKSGAAGAAAAATLATIGPTVALGASAGKAKLIPEDKVGTITFTQRDVPSRIGIAASATLGVAPTMGNLGGANIFTNPNESGTARPTARGLEGAVRVPCKRRHQAGRVRRLRPELRTTRVAAAPNPAPGGVTTPASRAAYLAYGQTLRGFLDDSGLEAIGNHGFIPNTWPGPNSPGGGMTRQRLQPLHDRARIRVDPRDAVHGHRQ